MVLLIIAVVALLVVMGLVKLSAPYLNSPNSNSNKAKDVSGIKFLNKRLLTPTELSFFDLLLKATPNSFIFTQVALSQLVGIPKGRDYLSSLNRINRMSIDFVICDDWLNTVVAIELDDPSHDNMSSAEKDLKKDTVLASAGIRLLRFRAEQLPSVDELRALIERS